MAELADAPDLGSGILDVQVRVLLGAPKMSVDVNIGGEDIIQINNLSLTQMSLERYTEAAPMAEGLLQTSV